MSFTPSYSDTKAVSDASNFVRVQNNSVDDSIKEFENKSFVGLWWDAKGFMSSSSEVRVLEGMRNYRNMNEKILACLEFLSKNDGRRGNEKLRELYKELEEMYREAEIEAEGNSKALSRVARNFLDNADKLDHRLTRVQCVVSDQDLKKQKEKADDLDKRLDAAMRKFDIVIEENRELKTSINNLRQENLDLKESLKSFRDEMRNLMSESNAKADQRFAEMLEETSLMMFRMIIDKGKE